MKGTNIIYVAGPLTGRGRLSTNSAIEYEINKGKMVDVAVDILMGRKSPYCPALDDRYFFLGGTQRRVREPEIKRMSFDFLNVSEAVVLCDGWKKSPGTLAEIKRADELGIPVFNSLRAFLDREDDNG